MTNWKADPKVIEAQRVADEKLDVLLDWLREEEFDHDTQAQYVTDYARAENALCEAVASSGSPPSPTPLNAKDKQDAERWRMFISKAHAGVTEDGDIWCGFSGGEPDDYTDVLTLKQVETLNNDDPSPRMAKDIVRRLIDDLVGARASSGSTGAPTSHSTDVPEEVMQPDVHLQQRFRPLLSASEANASTGAAHLTNADSGAGSTAHSVPATVEPDELQFIKDELLDWYDAQTKAKLGLTWRELRSRSLAAGRGETITHEELMAELANLHPVRSDAGADTEEQP